MALITKLLVLVLAFPLMSGCHLYEEVEGRAKVVNNYHRAALKLAKENRELQATINQLQFEIETLKSKNSFLTLQLEKEKGPSRSVASISPVVPKNDLVKYHIYKWKPGQLLAVAEKEFDLKNYEKSSQFFQTFLKHHYNHEKVNDELLFQAGIAAYETGTHYDWVLKNLGKLIVEYPNSPHYRGAKLWSALTHLKTGEHKKFFSTVEEFRKKYRNTPEWEILSAHYEKILQKYK